MKETLQTAKNRKKDEFYTQYSDIERELNQYDKAFFCNKVVYCPCDTEYSNFYKFFKDKFTEFNLKGLVITHIRNNYMLTYDGKIETRTNIKSGDFRENTDLLQQADLVITNPPFSLFREFMSLLIEYNKTFLIIGNQNAITYKDIYTLIGQNKIWLGYGFPSQVGWFASPYEDFAVSSEHKQDLIRVNGVTWFTNLTTNVRIRELPLRKSYVGRETQYPRYNNYDGIECNKTKDIPNDYSGVIGVPLTFLYYYNPNQFEIIKFRKGDDDKDLVYTDKDGKVKQPYFRILIRRKDFV